jgi:hypothetical protein
MWWVVVVDHSRVRHQRSYRQWAAATALRIGPFRSSHMISKQLPHNQRGGPPLPGIRCVPGLQQCRPVQRCSVGSSGPYGRVGFAAGITAVEGACPVARCR